MEFDHYLDILRHFLIHPESDKRWKREISNFLSQQETLEFFKNRAFAADPSIVSLQLLIRLALTKAYEQSDEIFLLDHFEKALVELHADLEVEPLLGLTMLDLSMLIACMHRHLLDQDLVMNFETVYNDHHQFVREHCPVLTHNRAVMMKNWENLIHLEILSPQDKHSRVQNEFKSYTLNVLPEEVRKAINSYPNVIFALKDWANKRD